MRGSLPAVMVLVCSASCAVESTQRPNVVFIFSDQQHYQAMGFVDDFYDTPNIDALAEASVVFEHSFVTTPQCSPSRSSIMTGLYPHKTGMMNNQGAAGGTELALPTIGKRMQDGGYLTAFMGKWHLGEWLPEHLPMGQGFTHQYGHYGWGIDYFTKTIVHNAPARFAVYDWHRNQKPIREEGYATDLFAAEAERVIATPAPEMAKPFLPFAPFPAAPGSPTPPPASPRGNHARLAIRHSLLHAHAHRPAPTPR